MTNACGTCTLCCTVMEVPGLTGPREPCQHLCAGGCGIYGSRPEPCRVWSCLWLQSQDGGPTVRLDRSLRPDQTGCVLEGNDQGNIIVHCDKPRSYRREPMYGWLLRIVRLGKCHVIIDIGDGDFYELIADGSLRVLDPERYRRV
jgi:hypothetical protein